MFSDSVPWERILVDAGEVFGLPGCCASCQDLRKTYPSGTEAAQAKGQRNLSDRRVPATSSLRGIAPGRSHPQDPSRRNLLSPSSLSKGSARSSVHEARG